LLPNSEKIKIYKITVLPVVYGCEKLACPFKGCHLRVFENMLFRRIFRPKRDEVPGGWRKVHNEEFHNLCLSPNTVGVIK
jgi:hypothetical protein